MEADFSGYATKAGLLCTDGRTIMAEAFAHQDKVKVPLVWQHGHGSPENVLGHAILEARPDGIYTYGFFNKTKAAEHARELLEHGDINMLSIWANDLIEKSKRVFHGAIREVSLVLAGANPGALIQNVTLRHDGMDEILEEEVIIYTGETLEHVAGSSSEKIQHEDKKDDDTDVDEETIADIYETMNEKQKDVLHFLVAEAASGTVAHALQNADPSLKAVYDDMSDEQKTVLHFLMGETSDKSDVTHSDTTDDSDKTGDDTDSGTDADKDAGTETDTDADDTNNTDTIDNTDDDSKGTEMKHNVFEQDGAKAPSAVLSHDDIAGIVADATKFGSLKDAVEAYAQEHLEHGIQDIDILFPEARALADSPELFSRRTEWVASVMAKVRKSPFSRIKTLSADLTVPEARAKGYIKGSLKKEEFFRVAKRVTNPTTIYKKQKLDRDDMIDITDFDVVTWLKGEMRLMLDEELARAILLGDGRAVDDEDKVAEDSIRPVAFDHELYTTVVNVNIGDASSSIQEALDAIVSNRKELRGSGMPTLYTTETVIAQFMLLRDGMGRRMYKTLAEVAAELRVESIVPVEVMEEYPEILGIIVNLSDYVVGADKGGNVSMFDDFDIDYNQYKYLIETRASGALVKMKSALVLKSVPADSELVVPTEPTFDGSAITIVDTANVVYRNLETDAVMTNAGSPYAVAEGESVTVVAEAAEGYYVSDSNADDWTFTNEA